MLVLKLTFETGMLYFLCQFLGAFSANFLSFQLTGKFASPDFDITDDA